MSLSNLNYLNYEKPEFKRYWPVPPIESYYEYQDINKDPKLREQFTKFFYDKCLKWIDDEVITDKDKIELLKSKDGLGVIYKLLRKYIKYSGINWYDLKDYYSLVKEYLIEKI